MGGERQSTSTQSTQTQQYTPTAEETELNRLELERARASQGGVMQSQQAGLDLVNQLLRGQPLPGYLQGLPGGISPEVTQDLVNQSISDIQPYFAQHGLLDSGVNASISARTAGDIRRGAEEFNIGNRLNLLNLALSGQAQVQQPVLASSANLGNRLAGLRSGTSNTSTSGQSSWMGMNPFMKSFQQSLGNSLGSMPTTAATAAWGGCWVASEIFGGWDEPETVGARIYMSYLAPSWLRHFYLNHGQRIAAWIHPRPWAKELLRPIFLLMARAGMQYAGAYR